MGPWVSGTALGVEWFLKPDSRPRSLPPSSQAASGAKVNQPGCPLSPAPQAAPGRRAGPILSLVPAPGSGLALPPAAQGPRPALAEPG